MKIKYNDIEFDINGVAINSADILPGYAFFCIVGAAADGHNYAAEAVERGASVIFCERELPGLLNADGNEVKQIIVDDTHKAAAEVACQFYAHPSREIELIGLTGTNGKTTTCNIISHVLRYSGRKTAVIGTTGIFIDGRAASSDEIGLHFDGRTTPDCISIQKLFRALVDLGVEAITMEVSSHALSQKRVWGSDFNVCAFTNLTQDHLDYHKTMENYFEAKALLFGSDYPGDKVICVDDEWGRWLAEIAGVAAISSQANDSKVVSAPTTNSKVVSAPTTNSKVVSAPTTNDKVVTCGLSTDADINTENFECDFPLLGKFNTQNMLVAVGVCKCLGLQDAQIKAALATTPQVDGRMQVVECAQSALDNHGSSTNAACKIPTVVVDYAHTPDALKNAASTLSEVLHDKAKVKHSNNVGRLIVVFGCGGDRDKSKRPKMGKVASEIADFTVITTDNPRTEDPALIIKDILPGVHAQSKYCVVEDRREAIWHAISLAKANDIVLIAGKGHEDYQEINGIKHHFDDREIATECLNSWALDSKAPDS